MVTAGLLRFSAPSPGWSRSTKRPTSHCAGGGAGVQIRCPKAGSDPPLVRSATTGGRKAGCSGYRLQWKVAACWLKDDHKRCGGVSATCEALRRERPRSAVAWGLDTPGESLWRWCPRTSLSPLGVPFWSYTPLRCLWVHVNPIQAGRETSASLTSCPPWRRRLVSEGLASF
jgi:hypothetical protein